jgi:lipid-A-disaccharide synthase
VKFARRHGIRTVYYFPPSQWTDNLDRHRYISSLVDDVIVAFKFTADRYRDAGLQPAYFGHPLMDFLKDVPGRQEARSVLGLPADERVVGLLPGSRTQEIESLLPIFLKAAQNLHQASEAGPMTFVIPVATPALRGRIDRLVGAFPGLPVRVVDGRSQLCMAASDAMISCSGTATLEAAILGIPHVITYRLPRPDYIVGKLLGIRVRWIGLPNLVMQQTILPEVIQEHVTPERLADEVRSFLNDASRRQQMEEQLAAVKKLLGTPGVIEAVADYILERLALGPTRHRHHHE